ncbi:MAG: DUF4058 family protein [Planctomycetaceae bacterium]
MTRPFPGMDPYLEPQPFWGDFAPSLLASIRNQLRGRLFPDYDVRIEEYLLVSNDDEPLHRVAPDVSISTPHWWSNGGEVAHVSAGVGVAEITSVEVDYPEKEPLTQRHLNVIHRPTERVVTVMELLSPSNKVANQSGPGGYLQKRAELLASNSHLIEIDLLRGGQRLPMGGKLPPGDYFVYIGRVGRKWRAQVIAWPLRARLPKIPIPLLPEDPEAELDLDAAFEAAYEPAYYSRTLPYREPLKPPLRESDVAWAAERLATLNETR